MIVLLLTLVLPGEACLPCHKEVVARYRQTPMARTSGAAAENVTAGAMEHPPSRTLYQIDDRGMVEIRTPEHAARQGLDYFLGSGVRGVAYLFLREGKLLQAPMGWYTGRGWDMARVFR